MTPLETPGKFAARWWLLGTAKIPIYALKGSKGWLFFEGGIAALAGVVSPQLRTFGIRYDGPNHWLATHEHYDHCGLLPFVQKNFPRTGITVPALAAKAWENPRYLQFVRDTNDRLTDLHHLREASEGYDLSIPGIPWNTTFEAGETLEMDGVSLLTFAAPGHSMSSTAFYEPEEKVLLISDAGGLFTGPEKVYPLPFHDFTAYSKTMEDLSTIEAKYLCLGHYGVIQGEDVPRFWETAFRLKDALVSQVRSLGTEMEETVFIQETMDAEFPGRLGIFPRDVLEKSLKHTIGLIRKALSS